MQTIARLSLFLIALAVSGAYAAAPAPTPAELAAQGQAFVKMDSPVVWDLDAPRGRSFTLEIFKLNGKSTCQGTSCPSQLVVPAGKNTLSLRCVLVQTTERYRRINVGDGPTRQDFVAGHVYSIRPVGKMPPCKLYLRDTTPSGS